MSENGATFESYTPHRTVILRELDSALSTVNQAEVAVAQRVVLSASRGFVTGAGRSGLARKLASMRLMPLNLTAHVAGEVTAPAIGQDVGSELACHLGGQGDLLIVASGVGTTSAAPTPPRWHASSEPTSWR
jgi:6-phospho-3-hexuloisomerase